MVNFCAQKMFSLTPIKALTPSAELSRRVTVGWAAAVTAEQINNAQAIPNAMDLLINFIVI